MKPEAALLTALAVKDLKTLKQAVCDRPDWNQVNNLASWHQIDALCWWNWKAILENEDKELIAKWPRRVIDEFRLRYLHHSIRNECLVNDLVVLQKTLLDHGVLGLYLKAPWLIFRAYPDPGTRPVDDIDLLVKDEQCMQAIAALKSAGWFSRQPLPKDPAEILRRSHYREQLRFFAQGKRMVELHFRLVNMGPVTIQESWLWEMTREIQVGPLLLLVPGPDAMLFHLMLHANQHGFTVLRILHDIRWALEHDLPELDLSNILRLARTYHCHTSCYYTMSLAKELAAAPVPDSFFKALRPSPGRRVLFKWIWRLGAVRRLEAARRSMELESPLFYLFEMGSLIDKIRYIAGMIIEAGGLHYLLARAYHALYTSNWKQKGAR